MNEKKKTRLARGIKTILDILFWTLVAVLIGLVAWTLLSPTLAKRNETAGVASIPVILGSEDIYQLEVEFARKPGFGIDNAWIDEARGTLRMETGSPWLILLANGSKLIMGIGLACIFYLLRKVMDSILAGDPFREGTSRLIRWLGYTFLIVGFGGPIVEGLASWEILKHLPDATPALHPVANFDARIILGTSLLIFLLSQIWSYGMELERDRALTV